jgi:hypothetical protein
MACVYRLLTTLFIERLLNHSPASQQEVLVATTAAFSGLSPRVAAWLQHPGSQPWLADLSQATRSDSDHPLEADQRRTAVAVHSRVG